MRTRRMAAAFALTILAGLIGPGLAGCSTPEPDPPIKRVVVSPPDPNAPTHTHETTIGDGTTAEAGGFRLTALTFPDQVGEPADLSFRIEDAKGDPVTDYVEEQTKLLHLYVVRDDLTQFRHLHPSLAEDGTWTARLDLAEPGRYRVIAEFVPSSRPGGSHIVLGEQTVVDGDWTAEPIEPPSTATDGVVTIAAPPLVPAGVDQELVLTVSDGQRGVLNLGTYLGAYAHLTGFDDLTRAFVHAHPLGAPKVTSEGSELRFHTSFTEPGTFRFFVQVRVDGFVHTLPITVRVVSG